jgi:2-polyprenyl-3-methyl-5-hydroxy-6-metoxy-1,4-benzoquinol methylase
MPVPVNGLEQHYGVEPGEYFEHHEVNQKDRQADFLISQAESLIAKNGKLLDVGSGRGEVLRAAKMSGWEATGIELSARFADEAAKHSGVEVLRRPLEDCGFASESFDVVILSAVLEHLYNPSEVIFEIARILRPGGALYLDVPNEAGFYFKIGNFYEQLCGRDWVVNLSPTFSPFHVFGFTPRSLRALLAKHGFEVRKWRVYPGTSCLSANGGLVGCLELQASRVVTALSRIGEQGTYMETWAVKKRPGAP